MDFPWDLLLQRCLDLGVQCVCAQLILLGVKLEIFHVPEPSWSPSPAQRGRDEQALGFGFTPPAPLPLHPVTHLGEVELPLPRAVS